MKKVSMGKLLFGLLIVLAATICVSIIFNRPDINKRDEDRLYAELIDVDGIGEYLAGEIIRLRPYVSWDDLKNKVDGVGDKRLGSLKVKFNLID
jgi:radical SAM superfamily enzyme with C-terminal helix-hairpin-helix motif